jgi:hypothetical protein
MASLEMSLYYTVISTKLANKFMTRLSLRVVGVNFFGDRMGKSKAGRACLLGYSSISEINPTL